MTARRLLVLFAIAVLALLTGCGEKTESRTSSTPSAAPETTPSEGAPATPSEAAPSDGVRYLALGDSLSEGNGATDPSTGSFPAQLTAKWNATGCNAELLNVAISGYTAAQVLSDEVPNIAEFKPTVITFQVAGNDIANGVPIDEYKSNVGKVLDAAKNSGARVYVLALNEGWRSPNAGDYPSVTESSTKEYNEVMIAEAKSRGAEFVDLRPLYKQQADAGMWAEDGGHPNGEAYAQWASELATKIPCK